MSFSEAAAFLKPHLGLTVCAAAVFILGFAGGISAVRNDMRLFLVFPRWLAAKLERILELPGLGLFAFIFFFNSIFIFIYMLTGAIHFGFTAAVDFLTGVNVAAITMIWKPPEEPAGRPPGEAEPERPPGDAPPATARGARIRYIISSVCGIMVLMLEMPAFWVSIAMGLSFGIIGPKEQTLTQQILIRAAVYVRFIVPMLLLSAAAEAVGIRCMEPIERKEPHQ